MIFRDFVEVVRDAVASVAFTLEGERDLTPMLHFESHDALRISALDPEFFASSAAVQLLAEGFVLPAIKADRARKVAWTFCAWTSPNGGPRPSEHPDRREVVLATFIDPEVVEHWAAPLVRTGGPVMVGNWTSSVPSIGGGPFIKAIQEALR